MNTRYTLISLYDIFPAIQEKKEKREASLSCLALIIYAATAATGVATGGTVTG